MNYPLVSIMIATFNSEKVLPRTLEAIRAQTYPQDKLEILAIDGGSTDSTLEIAKNADCKIIDNPKTEPVNARIIGLREARGLYIMTIDHDEVLENKDSIMIKYNTISLTPPVKVVHDSGYKRPRDYPLLNQYISDFGDPYSLFMYHCPKDWLFFIPFLKKNYPLVLETDTFAEFLITPENIGNLILEIFCGGNLIEADYFKKMVFSVSEQANREYILDHAFYLMLKNNDTRFRVTKNDPLVHYSVDSIKAYLPKLKWRIKNNIHFPEKAKSGITGRVKFQSKILKYKKFLFIPYALTIIFPFIEGVYFSIKRKNIIYMLHPLLTVYVAVQIIYQYILKLLGKKQNFTSYDGKRILQK